ncbi:MAG: hypothetical protein LUF02_00920 [Erysipelotrichaceae bacterium]|nr:hypothetical protein [Erysipelotrichaceae bacterium]
MMDAENTFGYYFELRRRLEYNILWDSLKYKTEYGAAERGYQYIAVYTAGNLALYLDCDDDLAEILTMCLASFFPSYGEAGLECVIDYMKEKGLFTSTSDLAINYIEDRLEIEGVVIAPEFDVLLHELFDGNERTMEIQIARLCHDMIKKIKIVENNSNKNRHDLLNQIPDEIQKATKENHVLTNSSTLEQLYNNLTTIHKPSLTTEQYQKCISILDEFCDNGNNIEGIYEYMSYGFNDEKSIHNTWRKTMVTLMKVKDIHQYYDRLRHSLDYSEFWHTLQFKTEYGPAEKATKESHVLTNSSTLEELYNNLTTINKLSLTAQQYQKCISSLNKLTDNGNNIEGIYEYISYGYCYM